MTLKIRKKGNTARMSSQQILIKFLKFLILRYLKIKSIMKIIIMIVSSIERSRWYFVAMSSKKNSMMIIGNKSRTATGTKRSIMISVNV